MPKFSKIPNKIHTTISIDKEKLAECKKRMLNLSVFVDEALEREFNPNAEEHFHKAVSHQNKIYKDYVAGTKQEKEFDKYKFGDEENVLETQKSKPEDRQSQRDIAEL